jgi:rubrerythrin
LERRPSRAAAASAGAASGAEAEGRRCCKVRPATTPRWTMQKLIDTNRDKVLDLLTARVSFERFAVKLYDRVISRVEATGDGDFMRMMDELRKHRNEEKEHEEWLEQQIRRFGGDAHGTTEMSTLEGTESEGIERIILDGDPRLSHAMHALLVAELADNAGWDLLVKLAAEAHDGEAKRAFRKRLYEEVDHLAFLRKVMGRCERREVLGQMVPMPRSVLL